MSERFQRAAERLAQIHREDPRSVAVDGREVPLSVRYHARMAAWLDQLDPAASEELRLAVRSQHVRRWAVLRSAYPAGRAGYKRWRSDLARFHGDVAAKVMADAGYDEASVQRVRELLQKRRLAADPEVQTLEDVACLVFLEVDFEPFAAKHAEPKLVDIVQKTWRKMSARGHEAALALAPDLPPHLQAILTRALSSNQ